MAKNTKIIAIIGLMGVGKSTIGSKLAEKIGYYFVDSDNEIEDRQKMLIPKIFAKKGEEYFRSIERQTIQEIIDRDEKMVLSLGGGAFDDEQTRKTLLQNAFIVHLSAPIDVILHRIGNKTNRPLLNQGNKRQILQELIDKRSPNYAQADIEIDTSKHSHDDVIEQILQQFNS